MIIIEQDMAGYLLIGILVVVVLFGLKWEERRRQASDELYYYERRFSRASFGKPWLEKLSLVVKLGAFLFLLHLFLRTCGGRGF
jgi:ABC-type Fe3+ transport system permease subunit